MPTATHPPRCPHRVVITRPNRWLIILIASLLGSTTATVSLYGQELEFRFVEPAGHMQLWPDDKPEIIILPSTSSLSTTPRIAAKWRTNLSAKRDKAAPEKASAEASKLPGPVSKDTKSKDTKNKTEVLVVPTKASKQPSKPHACYQVTPLSALTSSIALPAGKLPTNAAVECSKQNAPTSDARLAGAWPGTELHWSATCSRHRPLYFEEINAERYGYTPSYALQPLISAAHFFGTIPALPYKMAIDRPNECIYTLGHYRPGSCAPRRCSHLPWQPKAVIAEAGVLAGLILLVP